MIDQLGKREILIIKHLINAKKPLSSDILGVILGTSPKTIRSSMTFIGEILKIAGGAKIISKTGSGYAIEVEDENEFRVFMQTFNAKYLDAYWIPTHTSSRVAYIMRRLLMAREHIKMEQLMEELYVSRVTLSKDLKEVRKLLVTYHLRLEHRAKYGLMIIGREFHIRVALVDYLDVDEDANTSIHYDERTLYLKDPKMLNDETIRALIEYQISISNNSLRKIIKYMIVTEYRLKSKHFPVILPDDFVNIKQKVEYTVATKIVNACALNWNEDEIGLLAVLFISRRNIMKNEAFSFRLDTQSIAYSEGIIQFLNESLSIDLSEFDSFRDELAKHLRGMIYRITFGIEKRDVGILESKGSNPAFEYAVVACKWLSEILNQSIQETEIAFLSYRFYMFYRLLTTKEKSNVLIVLSSGKNASDLFIYELLGNFGTFIETADAAEFYEIPFINMEKYDLILTDIPAIQFNVSIPVKRVNYIFDDNDLQKIKSFFVHSQINSEQFLSYFSEAHYFREVDLETKEEVIEYMLQSMSIEDVDTRRKILQREKTSSTERGNSVAIPHTNYLFIESPKIAICLLKKPIIWHREYCQLVFLVLNGKQEKEPFIALSIAKAATGNIQFVYDMIRTKNFKEAHEVLETFIESFELY